MKTGYIQFLYNFVGVLILCIFINRDLNAQNISIRQTLEQTSSICGETGFILTVRNDENTDWTEIEITIQLPCGFEYIPSSVTGATELNISKTDAPVFTLGNLNQKTEKVFRVKTRSNCLTFDCLNSGFTFKNDFIIKAQQGQKTIVSDIYNVETANIIISRIDSSFMEINLGSTRERKVTIKNTRLGRVDKFIFKDLHDPIIEISSQQGQVLTSSPGIFELELSAADFLNIGNGDEFFDFNEEIIIIENIQVQQCILNTKFVQSEITTSWGCETRICQNSLLRATIKIFSSGDKGDKFTLTAKPTDPLCYYGSSAEQMFTVLIAPSISDFKEVVFIIEQSTPGRMIQVGSVQTPAGFTVEYENKQTSACGFEVSEKAIIYTSLLQGANQFRNLEFRFLTAFCESEICNPKGVNWKAGYRYQKACTESSDIHHNGSIFASNIVQNPTFNQLDFLINGIVTDGKAGVVKYHFSNSKLTQPSGEIKIKIQLPAFLQIINTNFAIGSVVPVSNEKIEDGQRCIELTYPLPLASNISELIIPVIANCGDTLLLPCKDSLITTCNLICESSKRIHFISAQVVIILDPDCPEQGLIKACSNTSFISECTHGFCYDELPGYVDFDMKLKRLTLGLPDKDGDKIPDVDGIYNLDLINRHTVYLGDTFQLEILGKVISDFPGHTFENAAVQIFHKDITSMSNAGSDLIETGIEVIKTKLRLWDKSENIYYEFDNIPLEFENLQYTYNFSKVGLIEINPALPDSFHYEDGDSIVLTVLKVFNKNFPTPFVGWNGHELKFKYAPKLIVTNDEIKHQNYYFACGCPDTEIIFIGFNAWSQWAIPGVGQCPQQSISQGVLFNYGYPFPSPGEIKFYIRPKTLKIQKVENISLDSVAVSTGNFPTKVYTTYLEDNEYYYVDLSDFTGYNNLRAGLRFWLYRTAESCIGESIPAGVCELIYERSSLGEQYLEDKFTYVLQNFNTIPAIFLEIQQQEYSALSKQIRVPLKLINEVGSQVRNVYIRPIYDAESFTNIVLELSGLQVNYPEINGYYILGNLFQNEIRNLFFNASALNCGRKRIVFEYGYDCGVYSNPAEKPCFTRYDTLYIEFPDGQLELMVDQTEKTILLCDTLQETKFLVFNGGLGHVYKIESRITLPKGMKIIEGSCVLIYPAGSTNTISIPNPKLLSGRTYTWKLDSIWLAHQENGLLSVSESPDNSFEIVYKTTTDCDFISGTREKYTVFGSQVCGKRTNELTKTGPAIKINGVESEVSIQMNVDMPDTLTCGQIKKLEIQYENFHLNGSTIYISLPDGVEPIPGSFVGNLPVLEPFENSGVLEWYVPPGVPNVNLSFDIEVLSDKTCSREFIEISTSGGKDAYCVETQSFCNIQTLSSQGFYPIEIVKSSIEILSVVVKYDHNSNNYELTTIISHSSLLESVSGSIYYDKNGDQMISNEDTILYTTLFDPATSINNTITTKIYIEADQMLDLCRLFLMIDQKDNCICTSATKKIDQNIQYFFDTITLCWNDEIHIGSELKMGKSYQWDNDSGLDCTQCYETVFSIPNEESFEPKWFTKTLVETDIVSGCVTSYHFVIKVNPRQRILSTLDPICSGDTISVFTTEFTSEYQWEGEDIFLDEGSYIKAVVYDPGWYYVNMLDQNSCLTRDSIFVNIFVIPETEFINDSRFCHGQDIVIGYHPQGGIEYQWIDPNSIIVSPEASMTKVNTTINQNVYLEISNEKCSRIDTISIELYEGVEVLGLQDSFFICKGDTLNISLSGANIYHWPDTLQRICLNDSCSSVRFIPDEVGVYKLMVEAITAENCKREYAVTIVSILDSKVESEDYTLCSGDSIEFSGQIIRQSGVYCDTIFVGACQYIQCKNINVLPPLQYDITDSICSGQTYSFQGMDVMSAGIYEVMLQNASGCDSIVRLNLFVEPLPEFTLPSILEIEKGASVTLEMPGDLIYQWSPQEGLMCPACKVVTIVGSEETVYTITGSNAYGCSTTKTLRILIIEICNINDIVLPNAFTPNGDSNNDTYSIPDLGICEVKITIFNRWGNIVYSQFPFDNSWDGKSKNGEDLPQGTYYILLESSDGHGKRTNMIDLRRQ